MRSPPGTPARCPGPSATCFSPFVASARLLSAVCCLSSRASPTLPSTTRASLSIAQAQALSTRVPNQSPRFIPSASSRHHTPPRSPISCRQRRFCRRQSVHHQHTLIFTQQHPFATGSLSTLELLFLYLVCSACRPCHPGAAPLNLRMGSLSSASLRAL